MGLTSNPCLAQIDVLEINGDDDDDNLGFSTSAKCRPYQCYAFVREFVKKMLEFLKHSILYFKQNAKIRNT